MRLLVLSPPFPEAGGKGHQPRAFQQVSPPAARPHAAALPSAPPVHVLPQGWDGDPFDEPPGHVRDLDVVFTGNMSYPPNRDAAQWIAAEIAPKLRARRPDARLVVVGRNADRLRLDG